MKKAIAAFAILALVVMVAQAAMAQQRINVNERLEVHQNGLVIKEAERTLQALIPEQGATRADVQIIANKIDRKLFGGKIGRGKKTKTVKGAFQEVRDDIRNVVTSVGGTLDTVSETVGRIETSVEGIAGDLTTINDNVVIVSNRIGGLASATAVGALRTEVSGLRGLVWIVITVVGIGLVALLLATLINTRRIDVIIGRRTGMMA